jgi:hypothetical protein
MRRSGMLLNLPLAEFAMPSLKQKLGEIGDADDRGSLL